jgi:hypothetical protein
VEERPPHTREVAGSNPAGTTSTSAHQYCFEPETGCGRDLLPQTDNLASATSSTGDFAIAYGDGASANALGGFGNFAEADGTDTYATAGGLSSSDYLDSAIDIGNNTTGGGAIAINGNDDIALVDSDNSYAFPSSLRPTASRWRGIRRQLPIAGFATLGEGEQQDMET